MLPFTQGLKIKHFPESNILSCDSPPALSGYPFPTVTLPDPKTSRRYLSLQFPTYTNLNRGPGPRSRGGLGHPVASQQRVKGPAAFGMAPTTVRAAVQAGHGLREEPQGSWCREAGQGAARSSRLAGSTPGWKGGPLLAPRGPRRVPRPCCCLGGPAQPPSSILEQPPPTSQPQLHSGARQPPP